MRIAHLSDIHFGAELPDMVPLLHAGLDDMKPDLVIVSGDFTQNGTPQEFDTARAFLKKLPAPAFCIPGNHDVPRLNMLARFLWPYARYKKYITPDLMPVFENEQVVIVGLNSARRALPHWNWANGAVSGRQLRNLRKFFDQSGDKIRICVFHHPVHKAAQSPLKVRVFGAKKTLIMLAQLDIDLVLTGHVHHASIDIMNETVFVSASTAISRRTRMQSNGFNMIDIENECFEVTHYTFDKGAFVKNGALKHCRQL